MEVSDLVNEAVQGLGSAISDFPYLAIKAYHQNPMLHPIKFQREKERENNFREKAVLLDLLSKNRGLSDRSIAHDGMEHTVMPTLVKNKNPNFEQQLEMINHFKGILPYELKGKYPNMYAEDAFEREKNKVRFAKPKYY